MSTWSRGISNFGGLCLRGVEHFGGLPGKQLSKDNFSLSILGDFLLHHF